MKKSRFTDSQIMAVLKRSESGESAPELCRELGVSTATFYKWRAKFGGMDVPMMARMKELEEENRRLRKMYMDEKLKAEIVSEALAKKDEAISTARDGPGRGSREERADQVGLRCVSDQRELLSIRGQARLRERRDRGLVDPVDGQSPQLGLWVMLPVSAQREGARLEPQAGIPHLPRA
jgi:putative transposase